MGEEQAVENMKRKTLRQRAKKKCRLNRVGLRKIPAD